MKRNNIPNILPYGYVKKNNRIEINETEAPVIKIIFEMYSNGFGLYSIYNRLRNDGYKTRNGIDFKPSTISLILANEAYIGNLVYNKTKIIRVNDKKKRIKLPRNERVINENFYPKIIDKKTFNKVREIKDYYNLLIKGDVVYDS